MTEPCALLTHRGDLSRLATPRRLPELRRHGWFFFPHSFDPELVDEILQECALPAGGSVLDPFVGAGTTLLAAQQQGFDAVGYDVSPLAVLAARAKTAVYDPDRLQECLSETVHAAAGEAPAVNESTAAARLRRAFSGGELRNLIALRRAARRLDAPYRDFFMVAVLRTAREFSRAVPDGGWFRWVDKPARGGAVRSEFARCAQAMIIDAAAAPLSPDGVVEVVEGDARSLPAGRVYDAVVTSPPYPNRHDYTRVFHVELLLLGLSEAAVSALRRRTLRSHPEARPAVGAGCGFVQPERLRRLLAGWPQGGDGRVPRMLAGYFEDMHVTMLRLREVLAPGAAVALVVGNVRHMGRLVPVDEILAEAAPQSGFAHRCTWVLRERGNSAQQMGRHGRVPSRESAVFLRAA